MTGIDMLRQHNQCVVWMATPRSNGRIDKVPIDPQSGRPIDCHDPNNWMPLAVAELIAQGFGAGYGAGFVLTDHDPFWFIDIDNCALSDGLGWQPIVNEIYQYVTGAAIGVSQSGRGIHIIGSGTAPLNRHIKEPSGLFDLYTTNRFVALSGRGFNGDAGHDCTAGLSAIVNKWLSIAEPIMRDIQWTTGPVFGWSGPTDDDGLIEKALMSRSGSTVFGGGVSFRQLWEADADALGQKWPCDHGERLWDYSEADASLAQRLAFWTGKDCARIERIMRRSALYRDKWDNRHDYLRRTIIGAVSRQEKIYTERKTEVNLDSDGYMSAFQQKTYFTNCAYILALNKIRIPEGKLCNDSQFRAHYGGYVFSLSDQAGGKTTRSAWQAFTESQDNRLTKVHDLCFRPKLEPGAIITRSGLRYINAYVPRSGETSNDPADLFLRHASILLPNDADREILLSYMAACVQLIGTKFQWAPCLQGLEGNGKTVFYQVLEYALGPEYCHQVDPKDLGNIFNSWIEQKLLVCVEEIRTAGNQIIADALKPLITNRRVPIQGKGADQRTGDNCANFILFSNHKDAVMKTTHDRRYCVLYSAQQEPSDLSRDKLTAKYFRDLHEWLDYGGGYAAVAGYLTRRPVNIDVLGRAPVSTSTDEAIKQSYGVAEQILLEAIESETPGIGREGLVNVTIAQQVLQKAGRSLSPRAVVGCLTKLGYIKHPALGSDGRLRIGTGRHRIYVKQNSPLVLANTDEIERMM